MRKLDKMCTERTRGASILATCTVLRTELWLMISILVHIWTCCVQARTKAAVRVGLAHEQKVRAMV